MHIFLCSDAHFCVHNGAGGEGQDPGVGDQGSEGRSQKSEGGGWRIRKLEGKKFGRRLCEKQAQVPYNSNFASKIKGGLNYKPTLSASKVIFVSRHTQFS